MMAAFIVAIRGTIFQAVLLGLAAAISHSIVVWAIALGGLYFYQGLDAETVEPYFQLFSAVIIIGLALWTIQRTWSDQKKANAAAGHDHRDGGDHGHSHEPAHAHGTHGHPHAGDEHGHGHDESREINTGTAWSGSRFSRPINHPAGASAPCSASTGRSAMSSSRRSVQTVANSASPSPTKGNIWSS